MENSITVRKVPPYAWGLVVATGLVWLGFGIVFYIPADTAFLNGPPSAYSAQALSDVTNTSRLLGVLLMQGGLFLVVLAWKPFRAGAKWAWYCIATVPILGVLASNVVYLGRGTVISTIIIFTVIPLLGLLLPIRSFFSTKSKVS